MSQVAGRLRSSGYFCLPSAVLALRPEVADRDYSVLRRAWRLSFALPHVLDIAKGRGPDSVCDAPVDRQALLDLSSTAGRLRVLHGVLRDQRQMMGAVLALETVTRARPGA